MIQGAPELKRTVHKDEVFDRHSLCSDRHFAILQKGFKTLAKERKKRILHFVYIKTYFYFYPLPSEFHNICAKGLHESSEDKTWKHRGYLT
jgi:hypothetical protein